MMAKTGDSDWCCVIDTSGLHALATASGNLKATLIAALNDGTIAVPSWAWREFKKLYEEEAAEIDQHIVRRIAFSQRVHVRAAKITEELNLGFSHGAYDEHIERYTAALALNKNYMVLTSGDNVAVYNGMNCTVMGLADWANEMA
jgi:hypothetical protein